MNLAGLPGYGRIPEPCTRARFPIGKSERRRRHELGCRCNSTCRELKKTKGKLVIMTLGLLRLQLNRTFIVKRYVGCRDFDEQNRRRILSGHFGNHVLLRHLAPVSFNGRVKIMLKSNPIEYKVKLGLFSGKPFLLIFKSQTRAPLQRITCGTWQPK